MTSQEMEEIKEQMCDKYCRMPDWYAGDQLEEVCENCPLNRLEADDD